MEIKVFQAGKGDCLLLEGSGGTLVLVDGGLAGSYSRHVANTLGRLREEHRALDLVCVSHIDSDHLGGILRMLDDEVEWRVFEFQRDQGNRRFKKPRNKRPPEIRALWHNAFRDQVEDNSGDLDDLLIAMTRATLLDQAFADVTENLSGLVTSKRQALLLMHRLSAGQLGIPVNGPSQGKLLFHHHDKDPPAVHLNELVLTVIGPHEAALERLREEWKKWLEDNRRLIAEIREKAQREAERLHADEGMALQSAIVRLSQNLGDRNKVTAPNLASLMLLVEDGNQSVLLTGDGHGKDISEGLERAGKLDAGRRMHVDVLKLQHHGSEHNLDRDFCDRITADHYVICSDGSHHNPDLEALETLIDARANAIDRPFKLWFNSSEAVAGTLREEGESRDPRKDHMREVEHMVEELRSRIGSRLKARFLRRGSSFKIGVAS